MPDNLNADGLGFTQTLFGNAGSANNPVTVEADSVSTEESSTTHVGGKAGLSSGQSINAGSLVQIEFDQVYFSDGRDSGGWDTIEHEFVVPADGTWTTNLHLREQSVVDGTEGTAKILTNGNAAVEDVETVSDPSDGTPSLDISVSVTDELSQGDVVTVEYQTTDGDFINQEPFYTYLEVLQIG